MKNPFGKTVKKEEPYAIYNAEGWEHRVLKTYKAPDSEAKDDYARWFLATKSPYTYGEYELGDGYVRDILKTCALVAATPEWNKHYSKYE